jgi:hypothetical protein
MLPVIKHTIQVTIVDDSKSEKCDAYCGVDWSSVEMITLARQRINGRFGGKIQLEYLDLSKSITRNHASELVKEIKSKDLSLPLLLIGGEPRISGPLDIRLLLNAIDTELELSYD